MSLSPQKKAAFIAAICIFLLIQYRLWFDDSGLIASFRLERQIDAMLEQNTQAQKRNQALLDEVQDLHRGTEMLEESAREDLGLAKQGEQFFLFIEAEDNISKQTHSRKKPNDNAQ